jgi:hypothetical protein
MRLGLSRSTEASTGLLYPFNEAEAHAPRIVLPYKPLDTHANSSRFRPLVLTYEQACSILRVIIFIHVKEPAIPII